MGTAGLGSLYRDASGHGELITSPQERYDADPAVENDTSFFFPAPHLSRTKRREGCANDESHREPFRNHANMTMVISNQLRAFVRLFVEAKEGTVDEG